MQFTCWQVTLGAPQKISFWRRPRRPVKKTRLPPFMVRFKLPDGSYSEQYANDRLWAAYRGASHVPDTFARALMALESWLLDEAHRGATAMDELLTSILNRSNNVALTAMVASVVTACPKYRA
jgi:hypothetical protein